MRGFVVGGLMLILVIGLVIFSSVFTDLRLREVYGEIEACESKADFEAAREGLDALHPFLRAVAPDGLLREAELAFGECIAAGDDAEKEKSRLLLAISELRRQAGISPASIL